MVEPGTVQVDGKDYKIDTLSDAARANLTNLRTADREIARLRTQLALVETARKVFVQGLTSNLPADDATGAVAPAEEAPASE